MNVPLHEHTFVVQKYLPLYLDGGIPWNLFGIWKCECGEVAVSLGNQCIYTLFVEYKKYSERNSNDNT